MPLEKPLYNESICLIRIESLVLAMVHHQCSDEELRTQLNQLIPAFQFHHRKNYIYNTAIQAFRKTLNSLNLSTWQSRNVSPSLLQKFVTELQRRYLPVQDHDLKQHIANEKNNTKSLRRGLSAVLQHYAKSLLIRIDLYFSAEAQVDLTIHRCHQYLKILLNRLSNRDSCFQDLHWWAWALEQGAQRGYHIHLLLVYDGHKHQNDQYLALQVGRYWNEEITSGEGTFYTTNQPKDKDLYRKLGCLGIGMIHRDEAIKVVHALKAASYLAASEKRTQQMLRVKLPKMRSFGTARFDVSWRRGIQRPAKSCPSQSTSCESV